MMKRIATLCLLLAVACVPGRALAQTTAVYGVYQPGWNMVGGSPGTSFSAAAALYAWQGGAYVSPSTPVVTSGCTGYWAYFYAPTAVPLAASSVATQTCPLSAGWNLVGDPFTAAANLPSSTTAYTWNPVANAYFPVTSISPGQSAWVFSAGAGTLTLTNSGAPVVTPPATLTINYTSGSGGPFQIHVGDTVRVLVPSYIPATASADAVHLQLVDAGYQYELTCAAGTCQTNPTATFWTWKAIVPGTAFIMVVPTCQLSSPPCGQPTQAIQLSILP